jgi:hypothetical protein
MFLFILYNQRSHYIFRLSSQKYQSKEMHINLAFIKRFHLINSFVEFSKNLSH